MPSFFNNIRARLLGPGNHPAFRRLSFRRQYAQVTPIDGQFPTTAVLDDANRSNESPLSKGGLWLAQMWNPGGGMTVVSNQIKGSPATYGDAAWADATFGSDQEAYIDIVSVGNSTEIAVACRLTNVNTGTVRGYQIAANISGGTIFLGTFDPNFTTLKSVSKVVAAGDSIGIRTVGTVITGWYRAAGKDWSLILTAADAVETGGKVGITNSYSASVPAVLDNFGGGTFVPTAPIQAGGGGGPAAKTDGMFFANA